MKIIKPGSESWSPKSWIQSGSFWTKAVTKITRVWIIDLGKFLPLLIELTSGRSTMSSQRTGLSSSCYNKDGKLFGVKAPFLRAGLGCARLRGWSRQEFGHLSPSPLYEKLLLSTWLFPINPCLWSLELRSWRAGGHSETPRTLFYTLGDFKVIMATPQTFIWLMGVQALLIMQSYNRWLEPLSPNPGTLPLLTRLLQLTLSHNPMQCLLWQPSS